MRWHAIVPLKPAGHRKQRLAGMLDAAARDRLCEAMLRHVTGVLAACPSVAATTVLTATARGLNAELNAARAAYGGPTLVLLADLPLLAVDEVAALLDAADRQGVALAADRVGIGTNAVAIRDDRAFRYRFGPGSLASHRAAAPAAAIVTRDGLARDIDTPDDLAGLRDQPHA